MRSLRYSIGLALAPLLAAFVVALTANAQAATVKLSDVLGTDASHGVVVGDKDFYGFTYQGEPAQASDITITTTTSPIGLRFSYTWTSTGDAKVDSVIGYFVHTVDTIPQNLINGVGLDFNGTTTSAQSVLTNASVTESVYAADQVTQLGQTFGVKDFGPGNSSNVDSAFMPITPPVRTLFVRKDIQANSSGGGTATITFVDNNFSQTPEPASIGMLCLAAGSLILRRKRAV